MVLSKQYNPNIAEPRLLEMWQAQGITDFDRNSQAPVYSIDTPPPTVSGRLHLGHVYSYSQTDFMARFFRMNGYNVYYPMGFDDNGLPTERLVETLAPVSGGRYRAAGFHRACARQSARRSEQRLPRTLWSDGVFGRLAFYLSLDRSRLEEVAQLSFLDLA